MITDSYIQWNRGDGITALQRRNETLKAMEILGCPVIFAGLRDDDLSLEQIESLLEGFKGFDKVYIPAIQGGNTQHDMIGAIASKCFTDTIKYTTYTKTELWTKGDTEVIPTPEELELKNKALDCYTSQLNLGSTRPHFEAVRGRSEYLCK